MTNPQEEFNGINVVDVFYWIDEFCNSFESRWKKTLLTSGVRVRNRSSRMQMSEILTIMVMFHWSSHRTFKAFYVEYVQKFWRGSFHN
jgi:hypothetical protein